MKKISPSEITPEHVYLNRRKFMIGVGSAAGALALAACAMPSPNQDGGSAVQSPADQASAPAELPEALSYSEPYASADVDELGDSLNKYDDITGYNN